MTIRGSLETNILQQDFVSETTTTGLRTNQNNIHNDAWLLPHCQTFTMAFTVTQRCITVCYHMPLINCA